MVPDCWREVTSPVVEVEVENGWEGLKGVIGSIFGGRFAGLAMDELIFRGHGSHEWALVSSFDRRFEAIDGAAQKAIHDEMLVSFRERPSVSTIMSITSLSDHNLFALLQHHGAPTRLLDWSCSPYVAAFFAFSSIVVESNGSPPEYCVVYALNKRAGAWLSDSGVVVVDSHAIQNERLLAQRGVFTNNKSPERSLEEYCERYYRSAQTPELALVRLLVPRRDATIALRELEVMRITSEEMFPGVDGAARYALFRALDKTGNL